MAIGVPARRPAVSGRFASIVLKLLPPLFAVAAAFAPRLSPGQETLPVDRIIVLKHARVLELMHDDTIVRSFRVDLGHDPVGTKERQGDNRTPEGTYTIDGRQISKYHLALHISYPSATDVARALAQRQSPGGSIFIHGFPLGYELADPAVFRKDWTAGCIAVSNRAIEEIWRLAANGTVVEIRP